MRSEPPGPAVGDRGESLIELMITMVVLSIGVLAVATALDSATVLSSVHRKQAAASGLVRSYGEAVQAMSYVNCAASSEPVYAAPAGLLTSEYETAGPPAVDYWTGTTWSGVCPGGGDPGVQRVTVGVRPAGAAPDPRVGTATLRVVITRPTL